MGVNGYREGGRSLKSLLDGYMKHRDQVVDEAFLKAVIAGVDEVKHTIDTTPSALKKGKPNRNWTYTMNNAVSSTTMHSGRRRTGKVGWIRSRRKYFLDQEYGGLGKVPVGQGMGALVKAQNKMQEVFLKEVK